MAEKLEPKVDCPKGWGDDVLSSNGADRHHAIEFRHLAQGRNDVYIELNGEIYRLLKTKNQKLILTK